MGKGKGKRRVGTGWPSLYANTRVYDALYENLKMIGISAIEWVGLPPEIDERFLELCLFDRGFVIFYFDDIAEQYVCLPGEAGDYLNVYNIPMIRRAIAANGYNYRVTAKDSVLIYNNFLHTPCVNQTEIFARRLYEVERAMDTNIKTQKFPVIFTADDNTRLSMENLMEKYDGNQPFIMVNRNLLSKEDGDSVSAIQTHVPFVSDKLQELKGTIYREALNYYGLIDSGGKRERLVSFEAVSQTGYAMANREARLAARRQAARMINGMFGLNIEVRYRMLEDMEEITGTMGVEMEAENE